MKMKRVLTFFLAAMMCLPLLVSCDLLERFGKTEETTEENTTSEEPEVTGPTLVINGVDISEFKILKEHNNLDMKYQQIKNAIYSFCRERLTVTEETDNKNLVRIVEDFSLMPNEYCIRVENGELQLGVFSSTFTEAITEAQTLLKAKLTGDETIYLENGFCEKGSFEKEAVSYTALSSVDKIRMHGGSAKDPLTYGDSDSITFRLSCISGDKLVSVPWIKYDIYNDTTGKKQSGIADASAGFADITIDATNQEGVVYIDAVACNSSKQKITANISTIDDYHFRSSAVVNLKDISMSVAVPEDFDSFWQGQVNSLYSKPVEVLKMVEKTSGKSGFKLFYVELRCNVYGSETNGIASGYLTYPTTASANSKVDLRVAFKGYSFSASDPSYVANTATFSVCAHSLDCERANSDSNYLKQQESNNTIFNDATNANKEKCYFRGMILRDLQAARFMVEYFGEKGIGDGKGKGMWNGENFTATGGSQGAFQSIAVAALDKNITYLDVSIPWMCDVKGSNGANGRKRSDFIMSYQSALEYYDTTSFAHLITCKTRVSASLGDGICPMAGVVAFYNALTCEKLLSCSQNASHSAWLQSGGYKLYN